MKTTLILALFIAFIPLAFGALTPDQESYVAAQKDYFTSQQALRKIEDQKNLDVKQASDAYQNQVLAIDMTYASQIDSANADLTAKKSAVDNLK